MCVAAPLTLVLTPSHATNAHSCKDVTVPAHGRAIVPTGLSLAAPPGTYARVAPRSGLAVKHFIDTGAGVVDEDYRGEVGVVLFNHGAADFEGGWGGVRMGGRAWWWSGCGAMSSRCSHPCHSPSRPRPPASSPPPPQKPTVKRGDRVAQLILERIVTPEVEEVDDLDATVRGAGGYGSTGVAS